MIKSPSNCVPLCMFVFQQSVQLRVLKDYTASILCYRVQGKRFTASKNFMLAMLSFYKIKVKQSRYRPGQARRAPKG